MAGFWSNSVVWANLTVSPFVGSRFAADYPRQFLGQVFLVLSHMNIFSYGGHFADLYSRQAAADDYDGAGV